MVFKVKRRLLKIEYAIDFCEYENNILRIKGWLFSYKHSVEGLNVIVKSKDQAYSMKLTSGIKRTDVYQETQAENAKKSGFFGKIVIENLKEFEAELVFTVNGISCKYGLGNFTADSKIDGQAPVKVERLDTKEQEIDFTALIHNYKINWEFKEEYYQQKIDIIVPIYNGYQFLNRLFETIERTKMQYNLILINDCSPDERISPLLHEYADSRENVRLIENEKNQGFVRNVNKGLKFAKGHVALVNSDVELPALWLERLMLPILEDFSVASATPYTNCGIITSFPEIGQDNELPFGLSVDEIDEEFQKIVPKYLEMPTGVGFCMAMNRKAIDEVGELDAESFGMGYGEENDWCQRAIGKGYRNVHVENLFVYHKHGGSFHSEEKKRYMREHAEILERKHPDYPKQVARFFAIDENKDIRRLVKFLLTVKGRPEKIFAAIDHDLGGGASSYLAQKRNLSVDQGHAFVIIRYNFIQNYYPVVFYYGKEKTKLFVKEQMDIIKALEFLKPDELWVNELVTYPRIYEFMDRIREFAAGSSIVLKMLLHDYFAVCPTINLLDAKKQYCRIPEHGICRECFETCNPDLNEEYTSMDVWRSKWKEFLEACSSVVVFSKDSRKILEQVYGKLPNVELIPHQIGYMPSIQKKYKMSNAFTIGLLGVLTKHKGAEIIKELAAEIEKEGLNIRIKLIGTSAEKIESPVFSETGKYTRDSIPYLTLKEDVDIFLIPSIWPETFSYTAEEVMKMGMPVMCFDIGAPAERVSEYRRGIIIPEMTAGAILNEIKNRDLISDCQRLERKDKKVLFIAEENTFASRYRVEHLREQLLLQGIASERIMISQAPKCELRDFDSVVLYRGARVKLIQKLVKRARRLGKPVYYDIDDFIFEYDKIRNLSFLQGKDYRNFERYSGDIKKAMSLCDGYLVSTETLKKEAKMSFPGKPVYVNRNVASMAMFICSIGHGKEERKVQNKERIYLGYFSGTKTHNEDFESIKDVILQIMRKNEQVYLLIGGQIQLPEEFDEVKTRIERFKFVVWRNLPRLIAKADINLMPLEHTTFHSCKSENKWMEAALVGAPTVAAWNEELERVISDGINGYLCKTDADWRANLQKLIDDQKLRKKIADAAYEKVCKSYTTFQMEQDVLKALIK